MWLAQGRVRAAFRLSDNARMFDEDQSFPVGADAEDRELLVAVEVNEVALQLVTLTEQAIYLQDIGGSYSSASPGPASSLDVAGYISPPAHNVADLKTWVHSDGIQYRWTQGATVAQDTLSFQGHWQSAYRNQIQDSLLFTFPSLGADPKLLVVKNSEAFAIVEPIQ
jgi:hypothetical protein